MNTEVKRINNQTTFKVGESVLISPEITHLQIWEKGKIIEIEQNPFVGIVIVAETDDKNIFFEKECFFKPLKKTELCLQ